MSICIALPYLSTICCRPAPMRSGSIKSPAAPGLGRAEPALRLHHTRAPYADAVRSIHSPKCWLLSESDLFCPSCKVTTRVGITPTELAVVHVVC